MNNTSHNNSINLASIILANFNWSSYLSE